MSHRWEFEDEYLQLSSAYHKAKKEGDDVTAKQAKSRLDELDGIRWRLKVDGFPELAPFSTLVEALEKFCYKNGLLFPDLDDRQRNFTGKGDWKEDLRFMFGVGGTRRSVQIWPMETRGYIDIEVYENGICYQGKSKSIEESAIVLSRWYMQECTIEELHQQFPWMSDKPFRLSGPRVTYK